MGLFHTGRASNPILGDREPAVTHLFELIDFDSLEYIRIAGSEVFAAFSLLFYDPTRSLARLRTIAATKST